MKVKKVNHYKSWKQSDYEYLKENYATKSDDEIERVLGRSKRAIVQKASVLNLTKNKNNVLENNEKEYALYKGEDLICIGTFEELAEREGVNKHTIYLYTTPAHIKRCRGKRKVVVELDD